MYGTLRRFVDELDGGEVALVDLDASHRARALEVLHDELERAAGELYVERRGEYTAGGGYEYEYTAGGRVGGCSGEAAVRAVACRGCAEVDVTSASRL